jgi:ABC-type Fe3+-hydroxamate transport system substrate-binding protein
LITIIDQLGQTLNFDRTPMRIISLVPSITETLYAMGLGDRIIGRTKFCIHPSPDVKSILKVGGTKNPRIDKILSLAPDLILANKEENRLEDITALKKHVPVYISDIQTVDDSIDFLKDIEQIFNSVSLTSIIYPTQLLAEIPPPDTTLTCLYLIWKNPYMSIGCDTYIHHMMSRYGFDNIFAYQTRYPTLDLEAIATAKPEIIMLSSEPYPFSDRDITELKQASPSSQIVLVDGELFSWYGSRFLLAHDYMTDLYLRLRDARG